MSICRSCGAHIRWGTTASGKAMPLDVTPGDGNVRLKPAPAGGWLATVLAGQDLARARTAGTTLYYPHHATCPQGQDWQRKRVEGLHHVGDTARAILDDLPRP